MTVPYHYHRGNFYFSIALTLTVFGVLQLSERVRRRLHFDFQLFGAAMVTLTVGLEKEILEALSDELPWCQARNDCSFDILSLTENLQGAVGAVLFLIGLRWILYTFIRKWPERGFEDHQEETEASTSHDGDDGKENGLDLTESGRKKELGGSGSSGSDTATDASWTDAEGVVHNKDHMEEGSDNASARPGDK